MGRVCIPNLGPSIQKPVQNFFFLDTAPVPIVAWTSGTRMMTFFKDHTSMSERYNSYFYFYFGNVCSWTRGGSFSR